MDGDGCVMVREIDVVYFQLERVIDSLESLTIGSNTRKNKTKVFFQVGIRGN